MTTSLPPEALPTEDPDVGALGCDCIATVDAKLAERNTRIMMPLIFRMGDDSDTKPRPMIVTEQIEIGRGKKKAVGMFASFCPFCGVKIGAGK